MAPPRKIPVAVNPWVPQMARIAAIQPETPGIVTYDLAWDAAEQAAGYRFLPGQFNMLYLPGIGEAALSISSSAAEQETVGHTVRAVGNVTCGLARLRAGDAVAVRGPFGSAWPLADCGGRDLVIAAGGIGLAPLRPVLYHCLRHRDAFRRVVLLYGARRPADLLYAPEYEAWAAAGIEVHTTVDVADSSWNGAIGVVPRLLDRIALDGPRTRLLTCGPEIMMRFVIQAALARGIRPAEVYLSLERNMNCAVGLCGHCQLGPEFICRDGPVFAYPRIEPCLSPEDL